MRWVLVFTLMFASSAFAQTAGTLNLQGPKANPANPLMSLSALSAAINAQMANKVDAGTALLKAQNGADAADVSAFRSNLGLGTAALGTLGTSGTAVPQLSAANTWGGAQTFSNGTVTFSNGTSNFLSWAGAGLGDPTVTSRSAGTKLVLYPALSGTSVDYAVGVTNNKLWTSAASSASSFAWFLAANTIASLDTNGFNVAGGVFGTSGNMSIAPSSSSALVNFKASSSGSSILQIGGSSGNVAVQTQLAFSGAKTMTGTVASSAVVYENLTYSGSSSNGVVYPHILQASETVTAGSSELDMLYVHDTAAAGFSGNRSAIFSQLDVTGAPSASGGTFVGLTPKVNISANMGGTGTTAATSIGFVFAENPVAHAASGATNLVQVVGSEIDVWTETGSSMMDRIGHQIVLNSGSNVAGARDDVALSINNQFRSNGGAPWGVAIGIGRQGGYFPLPSTGTIMKALANVVGDTTLAANGIDFSVVAFSGNTWNDGKTILTGAGQFAMSKMTASASAPGAGKMRFEVVAGTTGGTCKLIAYAGTSTTRLPYTTT